MANATGAWGLRPLYRRNGGNIVTFPVYIAASYAVALYIGSPVMYTAETDDQDPKGKMPAMKLAAAVNSGLWDGVIASFEPLQSDLTKIYNPASTLRVANVIVDPEVVFAIRGDGGGTLTKLVPGQNAQAVATAAGSTVTGLCGWHLDEGTSAAPTTTQTLPMHIVRIQPKEDNDLGLNAVYEVVLNTMKLAAGATIGITAS